MKNSKYFIATALLLAQSAFASGMHVSEVNNLKHVEIDPTTVALDIYNSVDDPDRDEMLNRVYQRLVDSGDKYVSRVKQGNDWKPAAPALVRTFETSRSVVTDVAMQYGIDARALIGAILTENTLNVTLTDTATGAIARLTQGATGGRLLNQVSTGFGQINCETAFLVEPLAARIERREARSRGDVCRELGKARGSLQYAAAILREAQDVYRDHGMDISQNLGVLTTLYNLGRPQERAARTRANGGQPQWNYFGLWTEAQLPLLNRLVGPHYQPHYRFSSDELKNSNRIPAGAAKGSLSPASKKVR